MRLFAASAWPSMQWVILRRTGTLSGAAGDFGGGHAGVQGQGHASVPQVVGPPGDEQGGVLGGVSAAARASAQTAP